MTTIKGPIKFTNGELPPEIKEKIDSGEIKVKLPFAGLKAVTGATEPKKRGRKASK